MTRNTPPSTDANRTTTPRDAAPADDAAAERADSAAHSRRSFLRTAGAGAGALALGPSLAAGQSDAPAQPDPPVIVAEDGVAHVTWDAREDAAEYVLYAYEEELLRTSDTRVPLADVWDPAEVTGFRLAVVTAAGETSESSWTAPYLPPGEREYEISVWRGGEPITVGDRGTVELRSGQDTGLLSHYEATFEVQSPADAARIVDVAPVNVVEDVEVGSIPEEGAAILEVTVPFPDAQVPGGTHFLDLTVAGVDVGEVTVDATVEAVYDDLDEPVEHRVDPATFEVVTPPAPPAPASVDAAGSGTTAIDVEWPAVDGASEYEVYVAEHEVPVDEGDGGVAIDTAGEPAARVSASQATVDGLDPLAPYDVGVVAVGEFGSASEPATTLATTEATEEQGDLPELSMELHGAEVVPGEVPRATLTISNLDAPLAGWTVEVRVDDPSVASVGDVSFGSPFDLGQVLLEDPDGAWATLDAVDTSASAGPGDEVELATVDLETATGAEGVTGVELVVDVVSYADDREVAALPDGATVDVAADNWQGGFEYRGETTVPQDLNGDGLYRDLNGDGVVGQHDVASFFQHAHRDVVAEHRSVFDYSGDGSVGHEDVVELFEYVALR